MWLADAFSGLLGVRVVISQGSWKVNGWIRLLRSGPKVVPGQNCLLSQKKPNRMGFSHSRDSVRNMEYSQAFHYYMVLSICSESL